LKSCYGIKNLGIVKVDKIYCVSKVKVKTVHHLTMTFIQGVIHTLDLSGSNPCCLSDSKLLPKCSDGKPRDSIFTALVLRVIALVLVVNDTVLDLLSLYYYYYMNIYNAQVNSELQMRAAAIKGWTNKFSVYGEKWWRYQSIAVQLEGCSMSWVHEQRKTVTRSSSRSSEQTTCMCLQTASAAEQTVRLPARSPQRDMVARNRANISRLASPPWRWCTGGQVTSAGHGGWAWYGRISRTSWWIERWHSERTEAL